ncbi:conserved hypothetical protein [Pseudomonas sp. 8BK]|uniref:hypothetical protein n=1 Tax=Pseudomonas sp. 8BK TaxID=2653164 RepID=UPI0012F03EE0|nr:hypothetical protein [Pseudomonas sp. 8BK]VXB28005.1 conserved hypothetical protein [Pseudomonas sp. 8BK]
MSELAKQEENGRSGESLTQSILLSRFWVLKRSADVDGADFLVQKQSDNLDEVRRRAHEIQILGIVQSKYFERSNQAKILKSYVLEKEQPRKEFFCSLHTHDQDGEAVHYFFSAEDVVKEFAISPCGQYYCFSLTKTRQFTTFKNPKNRFILDKIESGINLAEGIANKNFRQKKLRVYAMPTMHFQDKPNFEYQLMIFNDVRVVLVEDMINTHRRLLEPRRDLYENQGDFYWGDDPTGCQFLAVSILAHHFDGDLPEDAPVVRLCNTLRQLDPDDVLVLNSDFLRTLIETPVPQEHHLQVLEDEYRVNLGSGDIAFFEVISAHGTKLSIRCINGIESIVDTVGSREEVLSCLDVIKILSPGIERNAEPIKKRLAVRLCVERDTQTGEVVRILNAFDTHKIH